MKKKNELMKTHVLPSYEDCVRFHGHTCPGLAYGYRAAKAAMTALGVARPEDEEIVAICETDACGVDAIQVVAGTTAGKGNLIIHDFGKHIFTFFNRKNGKAARVSIIPETPIDHKEFDAVREKVFTGKATKNELRQFNDLRNAATNHVLTAPQDIVLEIKDVKIESPRMARIFASVICECCGEAVADGKTRIIDGKRVCIPCAKSKKNTGKKDNCGQKI